MTAVSQTTHLQVNGAKKDSLSKPTLLDRENKIRKTKNIKGFYVANYVVQTIPTPEETRERSLLRERVRLLAIGMSVETPISTKEWNHKRAHWESDLHKLDSLFWKLPESIQAHQREEFTKLEIEFAKKSPQEEQIHRQQQKEKQISLVKVKKGYWAFKYFEGNNPDAVKTPRSDEKISKIRWDQNLGKWKRYMHGFDHLFCELPLHLREKQVLEEKKMNEKYPGSKEK